MRKLLTIWIVLISFFCKGQVIQYLGSPATQIYVRGQLRVDTIVYLPITDTIITPSQKGAIVYKNSDNGFYLWNGLRWNRIAVGSTAWGQITGSISAQTDLISLLNTYQPLLTPGYGIKKVSNTLLFDSAVVRKVDTMFRLNDSVISYTINGTTRTVLIRGTAAGGINSLTMNLPASLFSTPLNFSNTAGAWSGTGNLINQNPLTVFAGPVGGGSSQPTFRSLSINDLPTGIPNAFLQNSSIALNTGTTGSDVNWSTTPVSLGGSATLNIPSATSSIRGLLVPAVYNTFYNKVDSVTQSNDTIYQWINGSRSFAYVAFTNGPASPTTSVQFNSGGTFGGNSSFTWDNTKKVVAADTIHTHRIFTRVDTNNLQLWVIPTINGDTSTVTPYGNFMHTLEQSFVNPDGQRDAAYQFGYNLAGNGAVKNPREASFFQRLESHFQQSGIGPGQFEFGWETIAKDGRHNRNFFMNILKDHGHGSGQWAIDGMTWLPTAGSTDSLSPYFSIGIGGSISSVGRDPIFSMQNLNTSQTFSIQMAGDGAANISNGSNAIQFGTPIAFNYGGNYPVMYNVGNVTNGHGEYFQGTITAGGYIPISTNISANGDLIHLFNNTSTSSSVANSVVKIATEDGGGSPILQFSPNSSGGKFWVLGCNRTANRNFVIAHNGAGDFSTPVLTFDSSSNHLFLPVQPSVGATDSVLVRVTGTGEVKLVGQTTISGLSSEADLTAQTAATTITSFSAVADGTFRVGGYITITAVSLDVIQLQVVWTDETNTSRTQIFYPIGTTAPGLSTTGANGYPTVDLRVKSGTTITVSTVLTTGTGSITYDTGASIIKLK